MSKLNKESMPCNSPRPANDGKHKRVVKACSNGQEKIVRYGARGIVLIILLKLENNIEEDMLVKEVSLS